MIGSGQSSLLVTKACNKGSFRFELELTLIHRVILLYISWRGYANVSYGFKLCERVFKSFKIRLQGFVNVLTVNMLNILNKLTDSCNKILWKILFYETIVYFFILTHREFSPKTLGYFPNIYFNLNENKIEINFIFWLLLHCFNAYLI